MGAYVFSLLRKLPAVRDKIEKELAAEKPKLIESIHKDDKDKQFISSLFEHLLINQFINSIFQLFPSLHYLRTQLWNWRKNMRITTHLTLTEDEYLERFILIVMLNTLICLERFRNSRIFQNLSSQIYSLVNSYIVYPVGKL